MIIIESPYDGDIAGNLTYARACLRALLLSAPGVPVFASHLLYTQEWVLDDSKPEERELGIKAGLGMYKYADSCIVAIDRGISSGMVTGCKHAAEYGVPIYPATLRGDTLADVRGIPEERLQETLRALWYALGGEPTPRWERQTKRMIAGTDMGYGIRNPIRWF